MARTICDRLNDRDDRAAAADVYSAAVRRAPHSRLAALACLGALVLATLGVPAMHAIVHAFEARAVPPLRTGPRVIVTRGFSEEIPHRHADGTWHQGVNDADGAPTVPAPHHHHDGDRGPRDHGASAPEHLGFAIAASAPLLIPPGFAHEETLTIAPAAIAITDARTLEARRSRGPPATT